MADPQQVYKSTADAAKSGIPSNESNSLKKWLFCIENKRVQCLHPPLVFNTDHVGTKYVQCLHPPLIFNTDSVGTKCVQCLHPPLIFNTDRVGTKCVQCLHPPLIFNTDGVGTKSVQCLHPLFIFNTGGVGHTCLKSQCCICLKTSAKRSSYHYCQKSAWQSE